MARRLGTRWRRALRAMRRRPLVTAFGAALVALAVWTIHSARQPGDWQRVLATREGLIGGRTATNTIIHADSRFVALPHPRALGRMVEVRYRDRAVVVPVLDVGPWNVDDAYWET